jgi:hypothetical protein
MNAARSLPPISALLAAAPFASGDRECEPFVVPAAGARNLLPASAEFSPRSALFAVGSALPSRRGASSEPPSATLASTAALKSP